MAIGRPPLAKAKRQSAFVIVRLTPAERRQVRAAAKRSGLSVSNYLRNKILGKREHSK